MSLLMSLPMCLHLGKGQGHLALGQSQPTSLDTSKLLEPSQATSPTYTHALAISIKKGHWMSLPMYLHLRKGQAHPALPSRSLTPWTPLTPLTISPAGTQARTLTQPTRML